MFPPAGQGNIPHIQRRGGRKERGFAVTHRAAHYLHRARELGLWGGLKRFWQRSTDEFVLWGRAMWWGLMARREMTDTDLLGRTVGDWRSLDGLLDHLGARPGPSFLLPHDAPQSTVHHLREHYPEYVSAVLSVANAACRNEFHVLGHVTRYPRSVDWHKEPLTGRQWPVWHRDRLIQRYLWRPTRPADLILSWELNRHQHFAMLGIAYWLTGDRRYADTFTSQVGSWIETNPVQHGVNWCYPLETSLRILAWTVAFQFFRNATSFRERIGGAFLKSLFQQARFVINHLQTTYHAVPNNHLIAEATGLTLIGAAFPEFLESATWRETGLRLLREQAAAQTHPDGVNKEQAIGYHRFIAGLLLVVVASSRRGILPREPILEETLERMLDYVLYMVTPDGTVPMWGDSDYGRALGLDQGKDFWDFRPLLTAGAALFGRPDWKFVARRFDEGAYLLLGSEGLAAWERIEACPPKEPSHAFPDAGVYVIRDTWARDTDFGVFRCGPFGLGDEGYCAHAHCDLLSLELWIGGRPLLVDSGTYTYHGPWRDRFRLTGAHNTLMVNGQEQATPRHEFAWRGVPRAQCLLWDEKKVVGAVETAAGVWHRRTLRHPRVGVWEIIDCLEGDGVQYQLCWHFHFAPRCSVRWGFGSGHLVVEEHGNPSAVIVPPPNVHVDLKQGWYSSTYGVKKPSPLLVATWRGEIPVGDAYFGWRFTDAGDEEKEERWM